MGKQRDRKAAQRIGKVMRAFKDGELTNGSSGKPVRSRKQALAIGLSEARQAGTTMPTRHRAGA